MAIYDRREPNKTVTKAKTKIAQCLMKSDFPSAALGHDTVDVPPKSKLRGRTRKRKDVHVQSFPIDYVHPSKDTTKNDDSKQSPTSIKQSLLRNQPDHTKAPQNRSKCEKMAPNLLLKNSLLKKQNDAVVFSLGSPTSFSRTSSQKSLEIQAFTSKKDLMGFKDSLPARPETAPSQSRRKYPLKVPLVNARQQARPSTAPNLSKNRQTASKEASWRRSRSPEVLVWVPKRTYSQSTSGHVKCFISGNVPTGSQVSCNSPLANSPPVTSRKPEIRSNSTATRKTPNQPGDLTKVPLLSAAARSIEGCRNSPAVPIKALETTRRCKSQMQRANDFNMQNKATVSRVGEAMVCKSYLQRSLESRGRYQSPASRATEAVRRKGITPEADKYQRNRSSIRTSEPAQRKTEKGRMIDTPGRNQGNTAAVSNDVSLNAKNCNIPIERTNENNDSVKNHKPSQTKHYASSYLKIVISNSNFSVSANKKCPEHSALRSVKGVKSYVSESSLKVSKPHVVTNKPLKVNVRPIRDQSPLFSNFQQRTKSKFLERSLISLKCNEDKAANDVSNTAEKKQNEDSKANTSIKETNPVNSSMNVEKVVDKINDKNALDTEMPMLTNNSVSQVSEESLELTTSDFHDVTKVICANDSKDDTDSFETTKTTVTCKMFEEDKQDNVTEKVTSSQLPELPKLTTGKGDFKINSQERKAIEKIDSHIGDVKSLGKSVSVARDFPMDVKHGNAREYVCRTNILGSNVGDFIESLENTKCKGAMSPYNQQSEGNKTIKGEYSVKTKLQKNKESLKYNREVYSMGDYVDSGSVGFTQEPPAPRVISEKSSLPLNTEVSSFSMFPEKNPLQDSHSAPYNIYKTCKSPVIVQPGEREIVANVKIPKITNENINSEITAVLDAVKECSIACEKCKGIDPQPEFSSLPQDLLDKLYLVSRLVSQEHSNIRRISPTFRSNNSSHRNISPSRLTSKECTLDSTYKFISPLKAKEKECFWKALDRLVACQEEVINAFASLGVTCEGAKREKSLQNDNSRRKSCQDMKSPTSFNSFTTFKRKLSQCYLSDSFDDSSHGGDRTYCVEALTSECQTSGATKSAHTASLSPQDTTFMISPLTSSSEVGSSDDAQVAVHESPKRAKIVQSAWGTRLLCSSQTTKTHTTKITIPTQLSVKKRPMNPSKKSIVQRKRRRTMMEVNGDLNLLQISEHTQQKMQKKNEFESVTVNTQLSNKVQNSTTGSSDEKVFHMQNALVRRDLIGDHRPIHREASESETFYCPDARCGSRITPLTLTAHLSISHPRVPSAVVQPGRSVCLAVRPAELLPSAPCIAAFLHVTDRLQSGPLILMVATVRDMSTWLCGTSCSAFAPSSSFFDVVSDTSVSTHSGYNLRPGPHVHTNPTTALMAWIVENSGRSRCTVRVLRRCECARRVRAAASYTGNTVELRRSQRLGDVVMTGAYVVAHPQLLALLQQDDGEVEVSAVVLPGTLPESDHDLCSDICT